MDTNIRLQKCFAKLGYFGTIPISLQSNPSTSLIWERFINNVQPKYEVDVCRKNIIIDRLQRTSGVENLVEYPIREIQVYNELKVSKDNIARIEKRIQEKQNKENFLLKENKSNYLQISTLKEHIEEKKIKLHILKLKSSNLENEIKQIDEQVNTRGLALISDENSLPAETVSNILQNLIDKIERLTPSLEIPRIIQNRPVLSPRNSTVPPPKKCFSTIKKNKSNCSRIQRFGSCANVNAVKSLFIEAYKENDLNAKNVRGVGEEMDDSRLLDQSAEILPDSCFDFRADDEFLMSFRSSEGVMAVEEFDEALKNVSAFDNFSNCHQSISQARQKRDYFERAHTDEFVIQNIDEMYSRASVRVIWTSLLDLREHLLQNIRFGLENSKTNIRFKNNETSKEDIAKLNFIYIKNNLLTLKSKKKIKQLMEAIRQKKYYIENQLGGHVGEGRLTSLELMLESIKLEASIQFMQKEMNNNRKTDSATTLNTLKSSISKAKEELFVKIKEIEGYIESKDDLMQRLKRCQEDAAMCVRRLSKFIYQPIWAEGLSENVHSREITVFREFPLDYNKNFCFTDKNSFYRDSLRSVILDQDTPNDTLYMITSLVGHPQYPPERTVIEALKKKSKLQIISSLKYPKIEIQHKNHSLQEFHEQEKYVERMCEMLISNIRSMKTQQVLNSTSRMKLNMDLWLNMPFKRFISKERTVEGKTYKEYEEKFDYLRSNK